MVTGVASLIIDEEKKVALVYRGEKCATYKNCWFLPCGHVKKNETNETAAERETKEETGLEVTVKEEISRRINPETQMVEIAYLCEIKEGTPHTLRNLEPDKHGAVKYFHINHLPSNTHPETQKIIRNYQ